MHCHPLVLATAILLAGPAPPILSTAAAQEAAPLEAMHQPLEALLDIYVRDGLVYYRALKIERRRLDRYIASLDVPAATYEGWSREQQMAFWINAYNVFVLKTVIDHYPIRGRSADYPPKSIRQIPGAFERLRHRAAGRSLTLDQIEKEIIPAFKEPRLHLALGRGALGSGRLRSEAYGAARIAQQLESLQREFVNEHAMLKIDPGEGVISVTPILSWFDAEFAAAYDPGPTGPYGERSAIERALIAFIMPHLLPLEREMVQKNTFKVTYHPFNWELNDLTGR